MSLEIFYLGFHLLSDENQNGDRFLSLEIFY